ncbi:MAG: pre-peptidase C-terminal domain-containing protein [Anaerolineae bacterium]|nr:pre-peptidase C-terminal domain-containing protein [Anaerolineae bacterium]
MIIAILSFGAVRPMLAQDDTFDGQSVFRILPGNIEGNINDNTPRWLYSFELAAGQTATIDMITTSGDLDPFLTLYSDQTDVLADNDDAESGTRNSRIIYTADEAGLYIIEATRFEQISGTSAGTYRLSLNLTGIDLGPDTNIDPLSIPPQFGVTFQLLEFEQFGTGRVDGETENQYFVLGGQQGDFVQVVMSYNDDTLTPLLRIRNSELTVISRVTQSEAGTLTVYATLPQTGWYLLDVGRESGAGDFTLYASRIADAVISSGDTLDGQWRRDTPEISYIFNATIGDRVFVTATTENSAIQPEVAVYDLALNELASRQATDNEARVRAIIPRSGPYIIQVRNPEQTADTFALNLRRIPLDINKLKVENAAYNKNFKGTINGDNPIIYYRFDGKAGDLVSIQMQYAEGATLDPYIILTDGSLNELAFNDNVGATSNARISQYALPADGIYYILATRAGLAEGTTTGAFDLQLTVGQFTPTPGALTVTLTWEGDADLNLFVRSPSGQTVSWSTPQTDDGGILQIDSNTGCQTPTAAPVEHIYWPGVTAPVGTYTIWVWYQEVCRVPEPVTFDLRVTMDGEDVLIISPEDNISLEPDERYEAAVRVIEPESISAVVNAGTITVPSAQQRASQGGDTLITYGQTITGTITDEVYALFYQFQGQAGDVISLRAEQITGNLDPIVVLRDANEQNLAINDDGGEGHNATLTYEIPETGRYIIAVTRYGLRDGSTTGDFRLSLTREEGSGVTETQD